MSKLQIIYTPEADYFRLSDIEMIGWRQPGDPSVQRLRENYQKLGESVPDLPSEVGIVTSHELLKRDSRKRLEELKDASIAKSTTTYVPLDVLCSALELRNKDLTDPLVGEYVYRTLNYLMSNSSLTLDETLTPKMKTAIFLVSSTPKVEGVSTELQKFIENIRQKTTNFDGVFDKLEKEMAKTRGLYPTFDDLDATYNHILERFKANKVSEDFPLYFFPPGNCLPLLCLVSLVDEIETPDYVPGLLKTLEVGAKAQGLDGIPEDVKKFALVGQKDKFGETKRVGTINELLNKLSEPKTIITDTYIVDIFPQLAKMGFKAREFKLE